VATQTLTFLFADIEGSATMVQRLGDAYAGVLADHHRLTRAALAVHDEEAVIQGYEFPVVFGGSPAALRRCGRWRT